MNEANIIYLTNSITFAEQSLRVGLLMEFRLN